MIPLISCSGDCLGCVAIFINFLPVSEFRVSGKRWLNTSWLSYDCWKTWSRLCVIQPNLGMQGNLCLYHSLCCSTMCRRGRWIASWLCSRMGVATTFAVQWVAGQADGLPALNDIRIFRVCSRAWGHVLAKSFLEEPLSVCCLLCCKLHPKTQTLVSSWWLAAQEASAGVFLQPLSLWGLWPTASHDVPRSSACGNMGHPWYSMVI